MIIWPDKKKKDAEVFRGPNIGVLPRSPELCDIIQAQVTIKVGDKITTDHIIPAGARMKYRSNIPKYSEFVFENVDATFAKRAQAIKKRESKILSWRVYLMVRVLRVNTPLCAPCIWASAR